MHIDRDTLQVRVYADSVEELGEVACRLCAHRDKCDGEVIKPCFVPCG